MHVTTVGREKGRIRLRPLSLFGEDSVEVEVNVEEIER